MRTKPEGLRELQTGMRLNADLIERLKDTRHEEWPQAIGEFVADLANAGVRDNLALLTLFTELAEGIHKVPGFVRLASNPRDFRLSAFWSAARSPLPMADVLMLFQRELIDWLTRSPIRTPPACSHVRRAKIFIREHYSEQVTLESVAAVVGRQKQYLATLFRQEEGLSVHDYLTLVRLHHAWDLIRRGEKIEAVSGLVGYRSKKNFYHQFKSHVGVTPGSCARMFGHSTTPQQ